VIISPLKRTWPLIILKKLAFCKIWYSVCLLSQINSKLGVKVAYYELPLSWLIFGANRPWPSWISLQKEICLTQGQIFKSKVPYGTILCSTSYEMSWWVFSKSTKILTLWRHYFGDVIM
jgi:hypothetical protein